MPYDTYQSDPEMEAPEIRYKREYNNINSQNNKARFVISGINGRAQGCNNCGRCNSCNNNCSCNSQMYGDPRCDQDEQCDYGYPNMNRYNTKNYNPDYIYSDYASNLRNSDLDHVRSSQTCGGNIDKFFRGYQKYNYISEPISSFNISNLTSKDVSHTYNKIFGTLAIVIFLQFLLFIACVYYFGIFMTNLINGKYDSSIGISST